MLCLNKSLQEFQLSFLRERTWLISVSSMLVQVKTRQMILSKNLFRHYTLTNTIALNYGYPSREFYFVLGQ